jgi:hypothetical protein
MPSLSGVGYYLRRILAWLRALLRLFLIAIAASSLSDQRSIRFVNGRPENPPIHPGGFSVAYLSVVPSLLICLKYGRRGSFRPDTLGKCLSSPARP